MGSTPRNQGGFTLLELLLSLAIFAGLAVSVAATVRSGIQTWRAVEESSRIHQEARVVLEGVARELRQAVPFPGDSFMGTKTKMTFHAVREAQRTDGTRLPGIIRVTYEVGSARNVLKRTVQGFDAFDAVVRNGEDSLTSSYTDIEFQYAYAGEKPEDPPLWKEQWQETSGIPAAVRVRLVLKPEDGQEPLMDITKIIAIPAGDLRRWKP